jgi:hypothetical protein
MDKKKRSYLVRPVAGYGNQSALKNINAATSLMRRHVSFAPPLFPPPLHQFFKVTVRMKNQGGKYTSRSSLSSSRPPIEGRKRKKGRLQETRGGGGDPNKGFPGVITRIRNENKVGKGKGGVKARGTEGVVVRNRNLQRCYLFLTTKALQKQKDKFGIGSVCYLINIPRVA